MYLWLLSHDVQYDSSIWANLQLQTSLAYGLQSVIRRKRRCYKNSTPQHVTQNVLNREFKANRLNEKYIMDVTEFK